MDDTNGRAEKNSTIAHNERSSNPSSYPKLTSEQIHRYHAKTTQYNVSYFWRQGQF